MWNPPRSPHPPDSIRRPDAFHRAPRPIGRCALAVAVLALGVAAGPPPAGGAEIFELEKLIDRAEVSSGGVVTQPMAGFGPDWGNDAQLFWRPAGGAGESLRVSLDLERGGAYDLVLYYTVAPDYGDFAVVVEESEPLRVSGYAPSVALRSVSLGRHQLTAAGIRLAFVVAAKDARSAGYILGIDRVELKPVAPTSPGLTRLPPRVVIPGPGRLRGPAPPGPREELLVVSGDRGWLGRVDEGGEISLGPSVALPEGLHWLGNFDQQEGQELFTWGPATGKHLLTRFPAEGSSTTEEVYEPQAFHPEIMRTVGSFVEPGTSCLLGWKQSESFGLRQLVENVCFTATAVFPIEGVAIAADVSGDGRDEAVFVTPEGTLDVVVLGGRRPIEGASYESLEFSMQRAADRWSPGLELAVGDFDGDGAQEIAAMVRAKEEVWRLDFDAAGRVETRVQLASGWPAERSLLKALDTDGDGRDELLVRNAVSGDFSIATVGAESLELSPLGELGAIRPTFAYPGRFLGGRKHALLLHEVVPGSDGRLGTVVFDDSGRAAIVAISDAAAIPEFATVLVGDLLSD